MQTETQADLLCSLDFLCGFPECHVALGEAELCSQEDILGLREGLPVKVSPFMAFTIAVLCSVLHLFLSGLLLMYLSSSANMIL